MYTPHFHFLHKHPRENGDPEYPLLLLDPHLRGDAIQINPSLRLSRRSFSEECAAITAYERNRHCTFPKGNTCNPWITRIKRVMTRKKISVSPDLRIKQIKGTLYRAVAMQ